MTDQQRIEIYFIQFENGEITRDEAVQKLLQILINISGERLLIADKAKHDVLEALMTNQMIKREHWETVHGMLMKYKEKL